MGTPEMQPVDFKDLVYAETQTCGKGKFKSLAKDGTGEVVGEFARELYDSFVRIEGDGQKVDGIFLEREDFAVKAIGDEIKRVVELEISRRQGIMDEAGDDAGDDAENDDVEEEELPKGCLKAKVTRTGMGFFTVSPVSGGKAMHVEMSPQFARVELGSTVVVRALQGKPLKDSHVRIPAQFVRLAS